VIGAAGLGPRATRWAACPDPPSLLTGHAPDQALARESGATAIASKPFRLQELLDTIRSQLKVTPEESDEQQRPPVGR
jgi:DNA-binding response OmpR family regulator